MHAFSHPLPVGHSHNFTTTMLGSRFGSRTLRFGTLDLTQWPEMGTQLDIDTSGMSWQVSSPDGHMTMWKGS